MSPEKIILPPFIIADLYKDCLIEPGLLEAEDMRPEDVRRTSIDDKLIIHEARSLQYLGENDKKIVMLVNEPEASIITDSDLTFLVNILGACSLSLNDIALLNTNKQDAVFTMLKEQLDVEKIILFNLEPSSINLPFSIPHFQIHQYAGCTILTAPALSILNQSAENSRLLKSKLWASLKQLFSI